MATQSVMLGNGHADASSHVVHPSWFKPESFLQADFNPQTYVAGVRKYVGGGMHRPQPSTPASQVPLDQVSHELDRYLATLKTRVRVY